MAINNIEKRKFPRIDTSSDALWKIRVFGVQGRPLEGKILNLSLGGVAFVSDWQGIAKAVKRFTTKVEIQLPDGFSVDANTTLVRVCPQPRSDDCVCVLALSGMNQKNASRIAGFIPN